MTPAVGHVRFGSKADIAPRNLDVRFTPKSGHSLVQLDVRFVPKPTLRDLFDHLVGGDL